MNIHDCARLGRVACVREALANGTPVDDRDKQRYTPLMRAAGSQKAGVDLLRLLIDAGADVNAESETDFKFENKTLYLVRNVLSEAASDGSAAKIACLLDAGANIHYERTSGYRIMLDLMFGRDIRRSKELLACVDLLLEQGVDVDVRSDYGETPLRSAVFAGRFDVVKRLRRAGLDTAAVGWTPLILALIYGTKSQVRKLLATGIDISVSDLFGLTPFLISILIGDHDKAELLLEFGATVVAQSARGQSAVTLAIEADHDHMLSWLIARGADPFARDPVAGESPLQSAVKRNSTRCVAVLLALGASPNQVDAGGRPLIAEAYDLEIVRLLLDAGADLNDADLSMRHAYLGLDTTYALDIPRAVYLAGKHRRFGTQNPEKMEAPFWNAMVRTRLTAYRARDAFDDTGIRRDRPVWCNSRFGQSITPLPDGRFVEIGGEHEDWYDPDFCIYNDVIVYQSDGSFEIYGYPEAIFPPTDFHTAIRRGAYIYVIGNLGYHSSRVIGETPVYRLDTGTWKFERLATTGQKPGWISRHSAVALSETVVGISGGKLWTIAGGEESYLDNTLTYALDLEQLIWRRL